MKFIERVENLKKTREVYNSSIESLINIYDKAPKEKQNELNNLDDKGFDDLLKGLKINIEKKSVYKAVNGIDIVADYFKNQGVSWHPILLYIFSIFIYALFFSTFGTQNIEDALGESIAFHFLPSLAAILIVIMILFNAYRKWFFGLMVTLIIITWSLVSFVNYIETEADKIRQEYNFKNN